MNASLNVLHVKELFLVRSEKWFHYILEEQTPGKKWLASRQIEHLDEFPLTNTELIRVRPENILTNSINRCAYRLIERPILWGAAAYIDAVKTLHPDIIHAHYGPMGHVLSKDGYPLRAPLITSFYGYDISQLPRDRYWRTGYAKLFQRGAGFIVEGGEMKKRLLHLGCDPKKAFIVRIPVDPASLPFKERHVAAATKRVILMCCNFIEKKGIPWALQSFALARKHWPGAELRIIGSGKLWSAVCGLIKKLDLTCAVTLLGTQPHSVFIKEALEADIFMQPSIEGSDGMTEGGAPTVLLEAQCMGLPVISSFHADIPDVVPNGESGYLVPEKDVEALSAAIFRLFEEPQRWP